MVDTLGLAPGTHSSLALKSIQSLVEGKASVRESLGCKPEADWDKIVKSIETVKKENAKY